MKTFKVYQNETLIGEYKEDSQTYYKLRAALGLKDYISAIQEDLVSNVEMSSWWDDNHKKYRINSPVAWCTSMRCLNHVGHNWIQVDFIKPQTVIGIQLQGRRDYDQWVTKFKLESSDNGIDFQPACNQEEFIGSSDRSTIKKIAVPKFTAKSVRFVPTAFNNHIGCRLDIIVEKK